MFCFEERIYPLGKPFYFWLQSARPSVSTVSKIATFLLDGRYLNSSFLSGQVGEQQQHACTDEPRAQEVYVQLYDVREYIERKIAHAPNLLRWVYLMRDVSHLNCTIQIILVSHLNCIR